MLERILYASLVDLSLPYGPGVNERGFLKDIWDRLGNNLLAVVPVPSRGVPAELNGLPLESIQCGRGVRRPAGWIQASLVGGSTMVEAAERFQPDLIVMRASALPVPLLKLARTTRTPYAMKTAGDLAFRSFYGRSLIRRGFRSINERMIAELVGGACCIDLVSDAQRVQAVRLFPEAAPRIHVVDNGVDLDMFHPSRRASSRARMGFLDEEAVVGYVGNVPMQRGGREVVDVVASMRSTRRVRGLIVGDGGEAAACRAYAEERGVQDAVTVYGEADYSDVPDLMASLDVGMSIRRGREMGQSELKVRQYLASGLLVVCTTGSNDILANEPFARVIRSAEPGEVIQGVDDLLNQAASAGMGRLNGEARDFACARLSIPSRNDQRLNLWKECVVK